MTIETHAPRRRPAWRTAAVVAVAVATVGLDVSPAGAATGSGTVVGDRTITPGIPRRPGCAAIKFEGGLDLDGVVADKTGRVFTGHVGTYAVGSGCDAIQGGSGHVALSEFFGTDTRDPLLTVSSAAWSGTYSRYGNDLVLEVRTASLTVCRGTACVSAADVPLTIAVEETPTSFAQNASITSMSQTGTFTLGVGK